VTLDRYSPYVDVLGTCRHAGLMPGMALAETSQVRVSFL
jgi:hypothetical protein